VLNPDSCLPIYACGAKSPTSSVEAVEPGSAAAEQPLDDQSCEKNTLKLADSKRFDRPALDQSRPQRQAPRVRPRA
jgi:hypothetical protein